MKAIGAETYLRNLHRSGLVSADLLEELVPHYQRESGTESDEGLDVEAFSQFLIARNLLTAWQHNKLQQGIWQGFLLGKYRLLDCLGSGGMSTVYRAEHLHLKRQVALKILPQHLVRNQAYLDRFLLEARAIAAVDHPNIVQAYSVDNEGQFHYLVMQLIEGRDLHRTVREDGPLSPGLAAQYIQQAAHGLAHAHSRGMIHRDIKPANLMVDRDGMVKVMDLGLAQLAEERARVAVTEQKDRVLGTADFLAPEQAINSHTIDHRADLYSLGCSFYFLLTGQPPFPEGSIAERMLKHQLQQPRLITEFRLDVPVDLLEIIQRMMAKRAEERFATAADLVDVLGDWLRRHGLPAVAAGGHPGGVRRALPPPPPGPPGPPSVVSGAGKSSRDTARFPRPGGATLRIESGEGSNAAGLRRKRGLGTGWLVGVSIASMAALMLGVGLVAWQVAGDRKQDRPERPARVGEVGGETPAAKPSQLADGEAAREAQFQELRQDLMTFAGLNDPVAKASRTGGLRRLVRNFTAKWAGTKDAEQISRWWQESQELTSPWDEHPAPAARGSEISTAPIVATVSPPSAEPGPAAAMHFSRDGEQLVVLWADLTLLAQPANGAEPRRLGLTDQLAAAEESSPPWWLGFNPQSEFAVALRQPGTLRVAPWEGSDGFDLRLNFQQPLALGCGAPQPCLAVVGLGPDGQPQLAVVDIGLPPSVRFVEPLTGIATAQCLAFAPSTQRLALGCTPVEGPPTLQIRDATTGRLVTPLGGHQKAVTTVRFSKDGRWLFAGSPDAQLVWDLDYQRPLCRLPTSAPETRTALFRPSQRQLITQSNTGVLTVWSLVEGGAAAEATVASTWTLPAVEGTPAAASGPQAHLELDPSGRYLAVPSPSGAVHVHRLQEYSPPDFGD